MPNIFLKPAVYNLLYLQYSSLQPISQAPQSESRKIFSYQHAKAIIHPDG